MGSNNGNIREFGRFRLDAEKKILWADGRMVDQQLKEIELLCLLTERSGEIITKAEMLDHLWADSYVEESNLAQHVYRLRKMFRRLGETSDLIQTVPRRGYRFVCEPSNNGDQLIIERHSVSTTLVEELDDSEAPDRRFRSVRKGSVLSLAVVCLTVIALIASGGFISNRTAENEQSSSIAPIHFRSAGDEVKPDSNKNRSTPNSDAYQAYLQAQYLFRRRETSKSGQFYQKAIDLDPNYAEAWAGLAAVYAMGDAMPQAAVMAEKAIALRPDLAEAHAVRGFIKMFLDWDWPEAEKSLTRAVELDERSVEAHHWLGTYMTIRSRFDEAERNLKKALLLDPASGNLIADLGLVYFYSGRYEEAESAFETARRMDEAIVGSRLADMYVHLGRDREALQMILRLDCREGDLACQAEIMAASARNGLKEVKDKRLRDRLAVVADAASRPNLSSDNLYAVAIRYADVGNNDEAIRYLEKALDARTSYETINFVIPFIAAEPRFAGLKNDPRFNRVLQRINLLPAA